MPRGGVPTLTAETLWASFTVPGIATYLPGGASRHPVCSRLDGGGAGPGGGGATLPDGSGGGGPDIPIVPLPLAGWLLVSSLTALAGLSRSRRWSS